ncbi:metallo-beta-lactamase domain-containing protein, partial [Cardiosporidium cionae]
MNYGCVIMKHPSKSSRKKGAKRWKISSFFWIFLYLILSSLRRCGKFIQKTIGRRLFFFLLILLLGGSLYAAWRCYILFTSFLFKYFHMFYNIFPSSPIESVCTPAVTLRNGEKLPFWHSFVNLVQISFPSFYMKGEPLKVAKNKYFGSETSLNATIDEAAFVPIPTLLKEHSKEFERDILQIADNVYIGLGYGLANSIFIITFEGIIVIDTLESTTVMTELWEDWKQRYSQFSHLPVIAIIYTHFHSDHNFGTEAIYNSSVTSIYGHVLTETLMKQSIGLLGGALYKRAMYQFGVFLPLEEFVNAGIGPRLAYNNQETMGLRFPTIVFSGEQHNVSLGGVDLMLLHIPSESKDQIAVWYPKKKILMAADSLYKAFPNIYAIRGTEKRDCLEWVNSLDKLRRLEAEVLLLGHTRPLFGKIYVQETLTVYRDAIQFLHDQTLRYLNRGYTIDKIIENVELPKFLQSHPYLQELYGKIEWNVRAIFSQYMGWFSGDSVDLSPMKGNEKSHAMAELAGGKENLLSAAAAAHRKGSYQWGLELSSHYLYLQPLSEEANKLRSLCLKGLASLQTAATGRNWYLSSALNGKNNYVISPSQKEQVLSIIPMKTTFQMLST